jgi:hypothetical protein
MKNLIPYLFILQSVYFYGQTYPISNAECEPYFVSAKSGNLVFSIDSIHKGHVKNNIKYPIDKLNVKEKTSEFNASKIRLYTHDQGLYPQNDSILMEYHGNNKIKQFLRLSSIFAFDTLEYRQYDENGRLLTQQYRYVLWCGTGYPYDEYRIIYHYDDADNLIYTLTQFKWNDGHPLMSETGWVSIRETAFVYINNKIISKLTRSNFYKGGVDSISMELYPSEKVSYTYEDKKLKEVLIESRDNLEENWASTLDIYTYNNDTISIETRNWDIDYQKWYPASKQIKTPYFDKENELNLVWLNNNWEIINRIYYLKSNVDTFFNYYYETPIPNLNAWECVKKSIYEQINDTIVNSLFYSKGYQNKFKYLYNDDGKILLAQTYQQLNQSFKKTEEIQNIYNENNLLTKSIIRKNPLNNNDTIISYLEYFWRTDIWNNCEVISDNRKITVYPNPAQSVLKLVLDEEIEKVSVFDTNSKLLSVDIKTQNIDISSLKPGLYFIRVSTRNGDILTNEFLKF